MQKIHYLLLGLIFCLLMRCTTSAKTKKEAFIASYYDSGMIFYTFEMYPDSSYALNIINTEYGIWKVEKDTFLLFENDNLKEPVAKIFELNCFYGKGGYRIITKMKLKKFNPPKVIVYPKFR